MAEGKLRVFPDANFLIAAGFRPNGDYQQVLEQSPDQFVTSEHVLEEVTRNLERLKKDPQFYFATAGFHSDYQ